MRRRRVRTGWYRSRFDPAARRARLRVRLCSPTLIHAHRPDRSLRLFGRAANHQSSKPQPSRHSRVGSRLAPDLTPRPPARIPFPAPNKMFLIARPMLLGEFLSYAFRAAGTRHRAVVDLGGARAAAPAAFVNMLRRISTTALLIFGGAPYRDYTYIFVGGPGGGLEPLKSTTIWVAPQTLAPKPSR